MTYDEYQKKFDQRIQKLIEDERCFVMMDFGELPKIVINVQMKEGPFLTYFVDIENKQLFCLEARNFPTSKLSDLKRRKHEFVSEEMLGYFKNCKLIRNFLDRYIKYCNRYNYQVPKDKESAWISNLNSLEIRTNNKMAAQKQ